MRILMLLESNYPPDIRVENEIYSLTESGHKVFIMCSGKDYLLPTGKEKITVFRRIMPKLIYKSSIAALRFPLYFWWWKRYVMQNIEIISPDVVHVHDLPLARIGLWMKKKYNIKFILDLHENWPALQDSGLHTKTLLGRILFSKKQWQRYERQMIRSANEIITICHEAAQRIIMTAQVKPWIVQNTINIETAPERMRLINTPKFTIFYGGAINYHRGLQVVLRAIKILPGIRLIIAGNGSYEDELKGLASRLRITDRVIFAGKFPFEGFIDLLTCCDVAIIPHLYTENNAASSPNKLFQYMYYGIPVIASDLPSIRRIFEETKCGMLYTPDSPDDLASVILNMKSNNRTMVNYGENGTKAVISKYNWSVDSLQLLKCYKNIMK